jgi:hypothetical protein
MMIRKILTAIFPNAMGVGPGWLMAPVWLILQLAGLVAIWSSLDTSVHYVIPWQARVFAGVFIWYAGMNGLVNKFLVNTSP